ncbi:hypothetical protein [Sinosporangium album]|uniref:hypothetical protein n=1 Tax=Sinosporangium album TaxID=504805 RepID=UPI001C40BAE2|nr:hypothetical protein [Sinosporangium album]
MLSDLHWEQALAIAELCEPPDGALVVGVGAGHGTPLAAVVALNETWRGIQLEHEADVVDTWAALQACGVAERCEIRRAYVNREPPSGAHLYLLADVSRSDHWVREHLMDLLDHIEERMPPGGWLVAVDTMPEDPPPDDRACECSDDDPCEDMCPKFIYPRRPMPGCEWGLAYYLHMLHPLDLELNAVKQLTHGFVMLAMRKGLSVEPHSVSRLTALSD